MRVPLMVLLLLACRQVYSQFRVGFSGDLVYSNNTLRNETESPDARSNTLNGNMSGLLGYSGSIVVDQALTSGFSIRAKFQFIQKGWKENVTTTGVRIDTAYTAHSYDIAHYQETYRINYFEVPLYFLFSPPIGKTKLLIGVGPFLGFALYGKYKLQVSSTLDSTLKDSADLIGVHSYDTKRAALNASNIDFGLSILTGLEFRNGIFVSCSLCSGLKDVMKDRYFLFANRYLYLTVGVGYFIGKSKPK